MGVDRECVGRVIHQFVLNGSTLRVLVRGRKRDQGSATATHLMKATTHRGEKDRTLVPLLLLPGPPDDECDGV